MSRFTRKDNFNGGIRKDRQREGERQSGIKFPFPLPFARPITYSSSNSFTSAISQFPHSFGSLIHPEVSGRPFNAFLTGHGVACHTYHHLDILPSTETSVRPFRQCLFSRGSISPNDKPTSSSCYSDFYSDRI